MNPGMTIASLAQTQSGLVPVDFIIKQQRGTQREAAAELFCVIRAIQITQDKSM